MARFSSMVTALKPDGVIVLNVNYPRKNGCFDLSLFSDMEYLRYSNNLLLVDTYIWNKPNPVPCGNLKRNDIPSWEPVFVFAKTKDYKFFPVRKAYSSKSIAKTKVGNKTRSGGMDGAYVGGHSNLHQEGARQGNVLNISSTGGDEIGRPRAVGGSFPVELPERFILQHTLPVDFIVDPFCGTGTTCFAANKLGRNYFGLDNNDKEVQKAVAWLGKME